MVITDVIMPRMGSNAMAGELKAQNPDLKVLFTSGYWDDAGVHGGVLEPKIAILPKPYSIATRTGKVRELLGASPISTVR